MLNNQDFDASAIYPMNLARTKGSKHASAIDPIISLQKQAANPRKNPRIGCLALQYKIHWSIDFYLYFMNPRQPQ